MLSVWRDWNKTPLLQRTAGPPGWAGPATHTKPTRKEILRTELSQGWGQTSSLHLSQHTWRTCYTSELPLSNAKHPNSKQRTTAPRGPLMQSQVNFSTFLIPPHHTKNIGFFLAAQSSSYVQQKDTMVHGQHFPYVKCCSVCIEPLYKHLYVLIHLQITHSTSHNSAT